MAAAELAGHAAGPSGTATDHARPAAVAAAAVTPVDLSLRTAQVSRSISRAVSRAAVRPLTTTRQVVLRPTAVGHRFATAPLNLRTGPSVDSAIVRTVPFATRLAVTGQVSGGWAEVLVGHEARWVNADYLAVRKPEPPRPPAEQTTSTGTSSSSTAPTTGPSGAPCPDGSATEVGLTANAVALYRAVCAAFPALSSYGGYDPHGEHADGRAIDFMVTDSSLGQAVADWVRANAAALHVYDVIWSQHIWTPERSSEGWRYMSDRGSATANHYDHVHVAVY